MEASQWIVARTKYAREQWAAENLANLGYEFYLPMMEQTRNTKVDGAVRKVMMVKPLFPEYLFVKTEGRWRTVMGTFGISHVLMAGDRPAIFPEKELAKLRAFEDDDGIIVLPKFEYRLGQSVRVRHGVFAGQEGIYEGSPAKTRVRVLLNLLGRRTSVLIAEAALEAA